MTDFILENIDNILLNPKILYIIGIVFVVNGLSAFTIYFLQNTLKKIQTWITMLIKMLMPAIYSTLTGFLYVKTVFKNDEVINDMFYSYLLLYIFIFYSLSIIFYDVFYEKFKRIIGKKND